MTRVLFLDDDPVRQLKFRREYPWAAIVSTAEECINKLQSQAWDFVYLDHDLGGETWVDSDRKDTGMEVVRWMEAHKPEVEYVVVHSHNDVAGEAMANRLKIVGYYVEYTPFVRMFW
jgi:ActR/RegA family two-component response regulator